MADKDGKSLSIGVQADFLGDNRRNPGVVVTPVLRVLRRELADALGPLSFERFEKWLIVFRVAGNNDFGGGRGIEKPELDRSGEFYGIDYVITTAGWLPHADDYKAMTAASCGFYAEAMEHFFTASQALGEQIDDAAARSAVRVAITAAESGGYDASIIAALNNETDEHYNIQWVINKLKEDLTDQENGAGPEVWRPKRPRQQ